MDDINSPHHPLYFHPNDHPSLLLISKTLLGSRKLQYTEEINIDHRIYQHANEIADLKQSNCTIEIYYHKLKGLWDELDAIEAPYACTYKYTCVIGKENGERENRKRLVQFIMGLDGCYTNIKGQILLILPLPITAKAYSMLRQDEKPMETQNQNLNTPIALNTYKNSYPHSYNSSQTNNPLNHPKTQSNSQSKTRGTFRKGVFYGYCKKERHSKKECYKILGYPMGHPLHKKYLPPSQRTQSNNRPRIVNIIAGETSNSREPSSS
uniref:Cysteine-rich RLK (Receptor-like protein kinase) 8 n=1 Tax=Tanacetum cinerariifolium TaxID=118510 RepID=A0A699GLZ1_TANCI|nr:cysteine-rich RLK (receptor-like protein kinase) 8 [Tanacetum cinerariifolium]